MSSTPTEGSYRLIRVFPRRTSMTPTDGLAFVGDPPLIRPEADEVHVSVTFTWDIAAGQRLQKAWAQYYPNVLLGGPAFGDPGGEFVPGVYLREGTTITSRGCNRTCPWCLVPEREGKLRPLIVQPGHIIADNNLLQTGREHMAWVFAMLRAQKERAVFAGGLDPRLVDDWVADQLWRLRIEQVFLSADSNHALTALTEAVARLSFLKRKRLRCYVMIGYCGESRSAAALRLEAVWNIGCIPFAQLYQPADHYINYSLEWRRLARQWSRPALTKWAHRQIPRGWVVPARRD